MHSVVNKRTFKINKFLITVEHITNILFIIHPFRDDKYFKYINCYILGYLLQNLLSYRCLGRNCFDFTCSLYI